MSQSQNFQSQGQSQQQMQINDLLKPIKDLAQVWQLDIEPYIDQFIVQITNQLIQEIDFREAAIIIQQTSQLFARKVDFLYEFANQILVSQPGRQKRRRTQAQQMQDLILNYDYDEVDNQLESFFTTFNTSNKKIVQTANLYLQPKQPYTILQSRQIIENNDIKITPLFNSIKQQNILLLEQWDEYELQRALKNDPTVQPINHAAPIHLKQFVDLQIQSPTRNISLIQSQNVNEDEVIGNDEIQLLNDGINVNQQQIQLDDNHDIQQDYIDDNVQIESNPAHNLLFDDYINGEVLNIQLQTEDQELNQTNENQLMENLLNLNNLINKQFLKIQVNQINENEQELLKKQTFQKIKMINDIDGYLFKSSNQKLCYPNYLRIIENEDEIEDDYIGYCYEDELFDGIQTGLMRKHQQQIDSIQIKQKTNQQNEQSEISNELQDVQQPNQLQLIDLEINTNLKQKQDDNSNQQSNMQKNKVQQVQQQQRKQTSTLFSKDYIQWIHRLESQIAKQTVFDVVNVKNTIQQNGENQIDIKQLSQKIEIEEPQVSKNLNNQVIKHVAMSEEEADRCKLARCFISSLFMANEGKLEFINDKSGLQIKLCK